jgi:O-antigen ligase
MLELPHCMSFGFMHMVSSNYCVLFVQVFLYINIFHYVFSHFHMISVLMKYKNVGFMITCSVLKRVVINVTVSGSDSMCCSILSARTALCMMPTIQACHNMCVIVI